MTCQIQGCANQARYIDETGAMVCGICPLKLGLDSIRIMDVPLLLTWARNYLASPAYSSGPTWADALRAIVGRKP